MLLKYFIIFCLADLPKVTKRISKAVKGTNYIQGSTGMIMDGFLSRNLLSKERVGMIYLKH